jgi:hypothetical protein
MSTYRDAKEDVVFAYLPMLRRVRRTSAAARSDPYMGSDTTSDDSYCYCGKVSAMVWKLTGEGTFFSPLAHTHEIIEKQNPDGSFHRTKFEFRPAYEIEGYQGVPFISPDISWVLRPCWIMQMEPKDEYYNYGKQILYCDKDGYNFYAKVIYNRSGEYWKTMLYAGSFSKAETGDRDWLGNGQGHWWFDEKTYHGTEAIVSDVGSWGPYDPPLSMLNPSLFTTSNLLQLSK